MSSAAAPPTAPTALDRATRKAFRRLLPMCFICYVVAYVDRSNIALGKLKMVIDLPWLDSDVYATAFGMFFLGYVPLEIPGTLLVERWSARKWFSRIMVSWGIVAALTAFVKVPVHFYVVRFALGLAEAGFFPGMIVYLSHWFPSRDRGRALATFVVAQPTAQIVSPRISNFFVEHPMFGLKGWQWLYIAWGIPAVVLGVVVLFVLTDRPRHAKWLTTEEREALEAELEREQGLGIGVRKHHDLWQALRNPKVLTLAAAYFMAVTANYGFESFGPSIFARWYSLDFNKVAWLVIPAPAAALCGQLFIGWSSDRSKERRFHTVIPLLIGAAAFMLATRTQGHLLATVLCFMVAFAGVKAYQPAFWSLPNTFLTGSAAAGSIGLINSMGNLGGWAGPKIVGKIETLTGSFVGGILCLGFAMVGTALTIFLLGLGNRPVRT
jgi:ACS family tartrate transporter-like MFS transporter